MNVSDYWQLFLDTGAPEAYLLYRKQQLEDTNVPDRSGHRPESHGLQ